MWTAPGIAPPRAARTVVPQYSPSLRVSRMTVSGWSSAARTSCQVAIAACSRVPVHVEAPAGSGVAGDRKRAAGPGAEAAVEHPDRRDGRSTRGTRTRGRRGCPTARRRRRPASSRRRRAWRSRCSIIHMNALSGAGSVSIRLTPNRSRWMAPGMWPAAYASAGRRSRIRSGSDAIGVASARGRRPRSATAHSRSPSSGGSYITSIPNCQFRSDGGGRLQRSGPS